MRKLFTRILFENGHERYGLAVIYISFVLISLLVAVILFGALHSTGILKLVGISNTEQAEFGGAFTGFFVTMAFLIRTYNDANKTAAPIVVKGNVFFDDAEKKGAVRGAFISIDGNNRSTISDATGYFALEADNLQEWTLRAGYYDEEEDIDWLGELNLVRANLRKPQKVYIKSLGDSLKRGLRVVSVDVIDKTDDIIAFRKTWLNETEEEITSFPEDVDVLHEEKGTFPIIDIKLVNFSKKPAYLKAITFHVARLSAHDDRNFYKVVPVSWTYNLLLDPQKDTDELTIKLSQEVPPNSVERFIVVVGSKFESIQRAVFRLDMELLYNDDKTLPLGVRRVTTDAPPGFEPQGVASILKIRPQ